MEIVKMKAVILCGGLGTRLSEETVKIPKPMVKIGDKPIIWHIMKIFQSFGVNEFLLAAGYKKEIIEEYFKDNNEFKKIDIIDTGQKTLTGGRLLRLREKLIEEKYFFMTYGDGLSDINIKELTKFHESHKKLATVTAVHPPVRFGELELNENKVIDFQEKPQGKAGWINGGFFVLNQKIFDYIDNDQTIFERHPMKKLSKDGELMAFKHEKFWQCMDTLRDKNLLNKLWNENKAPWKK
jgi:glucose-1-phosphate cytidylyltransferase